jgi:hypothetical protein
VRAAVLLTLLQAGGLAAWLWLGTRLGRGWATANAATGAAWALLFLVPCAVYTVAPHYLAGYDVASALAVVDVSLLAMLAGYRLGLGAGPLRARGPLVAVWRTPVLPRRAAGWFVVGLIALGVLMAHAGGPRAYLSRLDQTAGLNAGLFYVVAVALALRFGPSAIATLRWAGGAPLGRAGIATVAAGLGLLLLTGARAFMAVGLAQLLLTFALVRRRPSLRRLAPVALVAGLVLVFGVGAVKRHQSYNAQHPGAPLSLAAYLWHVAPGTTVDAYVNNYVDTVRLVAMAHRVVPAQAPFEGARPLEMLLLKPIPSGLRPAVARDPQIRRGFVPAGGFTYAEPLQVTAYLAGGPAAVVVAFVLVGVGLSRLDRWLTRDRPRHPAALAAAVAAAVQVPVLLRSGLPDGAAFFGVEVLGMAAVTWHVAGGELSRRRRAAPLAASSPAPAGRAAGSGGAGSRSRAGASPRRPARTRRTRS